MGAENRSSFPYDDRTCSWMRTELWRNLRGFDSGNFSDSLETRPERWVSGCKLGLAGTLDASLSDPAMVQSFPMLRV